MELLELFSGTKSISSAFERLNYKSLTIDNDPKLNPTLCIDILSLDLSQILFKPTVIWASPPCQTFSVASIPHYWTYSHGQHIPKNKKAIIGLKLLDKTIEIIAKLKPEFWYIENPRGIMCMKIDEYFRKHNIRGYIRRTVTYCQYGSRQQKPTDIWTNNYRWFPAPPCLPGSSCHESSPRSEKNQGTQGIKTRTDRGRIPQALCDEIAKSSIPEFNKSLPQQFQITAYALPGS